MRLPVVVVVIWLTIGVIALIQRGCLSGSSSNCAKASNTTVTSSVQVACGGVRSPGPMMSRRLDGRRGTASSSNGRRSVCRAWIV